MPLIEKWAPFRELDGLDRRMRRFFEEFGAMPALTPSADVYETDGEVVVELEVPGYDEKELEIEVRDHTLAITGEREEELTKTEKTLRVHERLETHFERHFTLPPDIDGEHVRAAYTKGVLTVHIPKTVHGQPRKVAITTT
jgi:HSP20 family protein